MRTIHYILIGCFALTTACATSSSYRSLENQENQDSEESELIIPAGVDSVTAAESSELADSSFVSYEEEQEAKALKRQANAYRAESDTLWSVLSVDTSNASNSADQQDSPEFVENFNEGAESFTEAREIARSENVSEQDLDKYAQLVTNAIEDFEKALQINPFDSQTRVLLAQLYSTKANRLNQEENYEKAIDILEKLVRIEKGDHIIYYALGENYYLVENYTLAAKKFEEASEVLHETVPLTDYYYENNSYSPEDSTRAYTYELYAGLSQIEMFEAERALESFNEARQYATSESEIADLQNQIDFINWDDGNILGAMRRDSLVNLRNNGQLEDAESGFIDLNNFLQTQSAKDEINWRLGVVQYELGKQDAAAERLLNLVERTETNENGAPVDSLYNRYFNDFGTITYNIGIQYLNDNERRMALKYLTQSSKINWNARARSHLRIANLLENNLPEALKHAKMAEEEIESLNNSDKRALYSLLSGFQRRNGNMEEARNYQQLWRELQEQEES